MSIQSLTIFFENIYILLSNLSNLFFLLNSAYFYIIFSLYFLILKESLQKNLKP